MTTKIAVSLPDELVAQARAAVRAGRSASVSAYVAEALAEKQRRQSLTALLDELDAALGPPDADALAWADQAFQG